MMTDLELASRSKPTSNPQDNRNNEPRLHATNPYEWRPEFYFHLIDPQDETLMNHNEEFTVGEIEILIAVADAWLLIIKSMNLKDLAWNHWSAELESIE